MMNRSFILPLSALVVAVACNERQQMPPSQAIQIKSVLESWHEAIEGGYEPKPLSEKEMLRTTFDRSGNIIRIERYNHRGALVGREESKYQGGRLRETLHYQFQDLQFRIIREYDPSNRLTRVSKLNESGKAISVQTYRYDSIPIIIETTLEPLKGRLTLVSETFFNAQHLPDVVRTYDPQGIAKSLKTFVYDSVNQCIEYHYRNVNDHLKESHSIYYRYDTLGQNTEAVTINSHGLVQNRTRYAYDSLGNLSAEWLLGMDGNYRTIESRKYTYNEHGHWLTMTVIENSIPSYVVKRELKYY